MNTDILALMKKTAGEARQIILSNFRQVTASDKTSHIDIVTKTDTESQNFIHTKLVKGMEQLGISSEMVGFIEEESAVDALKEHNFMVDPIDGTTNFASGIPYCCISIGYAVGEKMIVGLVMDVFSGKMYWGEVGKGSFVTDGTQERKLELKTKEMKSWMVAAHLNGMDIVDEQFATYQKIYTEVRGLRNLGSLTLDLCMMADDVFDVVYNRGCYAWDLAASQVILREAGAELYDYSGNVLKFDFTDSKKKYQLVACLPSSLDIAKSFI